MNDFSASLSLSLHLFPSLSLSIFQMLPVTLLAFKPPPLSFPAFPRFPWTWLIIISTSFRATFIRYYQLNVADMVKPLDPRFKGLARIPWFISVWIHFNDANSSQSPAESFLRNDSFYSEIHRGFTKGHLIYSDWFQQPKRRLANWSRLTISISSYMKWTGF